MAHSALMPQEDHSKARGIRLPNETWAELESLAESRGMTRHALICQTLTATLKKARSANSEPQVQS